MIFSGGIDFQCRLFLPRRFSNVLCRSPNQRFVSYLAEIDRALFAGIFNYALAKQQAPL
jgi:hypothetical protein